VKDFGIEFVLFLVVVYRIYILSLSMTGVVQFTPLSLCSVCSCNKKIVLCKPVMHTWGTAGKYFTGVKELY
jgi:hypothetical protein